MSKSTRTVRRQFIDGKYGQIHLRTAGALSSKPTIVCLHMMPKSSRSYEALMLELSSDRLVIAPDYYGYGESSTFPDDLKPSMSDYVDSVSEVLTHFGLTEVYLVGYHTGSMVSAELALRHPEIVKKLISISAPLFSQKEIAEFHSFFAPIPLDEEGTRFRIMWERVVHFAGPGMTLEMSADSMAENLRGGERYEDGHQAAFDYSLEYAQTLSKLQQPIWVMNLGDDLYEHSKRVDQYLVNGSRTDFTGYGHGSLELHAVEIAELMGDFFDN